jgi:hypothetical protein
MDLNVKLQGLKCNYEKVQGCFYKILRFQWFSRFMELFSFRKICRICPQHHGPGPPASAHGSTNFIKGWPLATGSMAQIKPIESVSRLLISAVHHRSDRGRRRLVLTAARHGRARRLTGVHVFWSYGDWFSMRFAPTGSQRWGERVYANLNRWRAAMKPDNSEAARPVLVDGEGGLRWSFGSNDMCQGFLKLPSSFSTSQLLRSAVENSNLVAT